MENTSIKEKIFYWGSLTLLTSVILGGSYYIYKSIFGSEENENKNIDKDNLKVNLNNNNDENNYNEEINSENINNNENKNSKNNINNENNKENISISKNIISSIFPTKLYNLIDNRSRTPISKKQNNINNGNDEQENSNIIKNSCNAHNSINMGYLH